MDVKVNIDAADIEAQVTKAIIETAFGAKLKEAIEQAIKGLGSSYSWDGKLKDWVEQKMRAIVFDHVEAQYSKQIEDNIRTWLTSDKLKEVTDKVISAVVSDLTTKSRY